MDCGSTISRSREDDRQRLFEPPDRVENPRRIFRGGFDDRLADGDVDSEAFDFLDDRRARAAADSDQPPVRRKREDRAVFADDGIKACQVAGGLLQVGQAAAGDQQDHDAAATSLFDRVPHGGMKAAFDGNRPVVVERERRKLHASG
jgi:hypothetical protein